ncbi:MAG TPA: YCF48-related protein [Bacteroidales bacterium]|nr:YCF48-related protein [Bacteroidales bacterium]
MKRFFLFFSCLVSSYLLNAQDWIWVQSNTNNILNSVHFPSIDTGYIAGNYGTILKTTDGGNTWLTLNSGTSSPLYGIFFTDSENGFAVGNHHILKTIDGGQTWIEKESGWGTKNAVYFYDNQTGYVAGDIGGYPCIYKTTDSGETWLQKTVNASYDYYLRSIDFVTPNIGFAVGFLYTGNPDFENHSGILKTTDGGETWNEQDFGNINARLTSVYFLNSQIGFIVGGQYHINGQDKGIVFKTINGGQTWQSTLIETSQRLESVYFINEQTGYIFGIFGKILKTTDGGFSWSQTDTIWTFFYSVYFSSIDNGVAVGDNGSIIKTDFTNQFSHVIETEYNSYPNPTNTYVNIPLYNFTEDLSYLTIYNSWGQVVKHQIINTDFEKVTLDVSMFEKGIYYYKYNNLKGKFIVY